MDQRATGQVYNVSNDCALEEMISGMASALNVASPKLRLPEQLVRMVVKVVSSVTQFPLTQERIDALVSRTRYPSSKLERELGFVPNITVSSAIGEIV
jgi:nucleoside-diphosphate-sugar epimerase